MAAVCTIATGTAIKDLKVFFFTLKQFNAQPPPVFLVCDNDVKNYIETEKPYSGEIHIKSSLNYAKDLDRSAMERQRGTVYKTLWEDFMMEKATALEYAFESGVQSVFFFDSDICFMGPLPTQTTAVAKIGVCPHMIKPRDEARFGKYNAGYVWTSDKTMPALWRKAAHTSYFYDQAALETITNDYMKANPENVFTFPVQNNYGWWRMFQGVESPAELQAKWSFNRNTGQNISGLLVENSPLLSVHTHWETRDMVTMTFNHFVFKKLQILHMYPNAAALVKFFQKEFPYLK